MGLEFWVAGVTMFFSVFVFVFWNYVILKHNLRDVGWRATKGDLLFAWQTLGDCHQLDPLIFGEKTVVPRLPTNPHRLLPKMYWTGLPLWQCCGLSRRSARVLLWRIGWESLLSMPCRHGKHKTFFCSGVYKTTPHSFQGLRIKLQLIIFVENTVNQRAVGSHQAFWHTKTHTDTLAKLGSHRFLSSGTGTQKIQTGWLVVISLTFLVKVWEIFESNHSCCWQCVSHDPSDDRGLASENQRLEGEISFWYNHGLC